MTTIRSAAAVADTVVKAAMTAEPFAATVASFIPGAAPVVAIVAPAVAAAAPFVEQALESIAQGNGGDAFGAFISLLQHLTPGQQNASALGPKAPSVAPAGTDASAATDPQASPAG